MRLFFLPSSSPELSPDEQVWNHMENHGVGRMTPAGPNQLKRAVLRRLRSLQRLPAIVAGFFRRRETLRRTFTPTRSTLRAADAGIFLRFPGQWADGLIEEGGVYNVNRWYQATTGRYSRVDPLLVSHEVSVDELAYVYAESSPFLMTAHRWRCWVSSWLVWFYRRWRGSDRRWEQWPTRQARSCCGVGERRALVSSARALARSERTRTLGLADGWTTGCVPFEIDGPSFERKAEE